MEKAGDATEEAGLRNRGFYVPRTNEERENLVLDRWPLLVGRLFGTIMKWY
jgi:hypothetical protein